MQQQGEEKVFVIVAVVAVVVVVVVIVVAIAVDVVVVVGVFENLLQQTLIGFKENQWSSSAVLFPVSRHTN